MLHITIGKIPYDFRIFLILVHFFLEKKSKSNVTIINYFTIFLQIVDITDFLLIFILTTINITFSFTNNHLSHQ